ncbi:MAG: alpha-1,4-glucan--maltose-1-phosphate maltosyltransferase [Candidatus Brocadiae bacterium]|nr:alpha-1,4-glucan--maltose-1-phosphate maltosyltransferase [Candidatus Brocadiia bacterium]
MARATAAARTTRAQRRILIENVRPSVDGGRHPAKRTSGQPCEVAATIVRDGHATLHAVVRWRAAGRAAATEVPMTLTNPGLDLWTGAFPLEQNGRYHFTVEAWTDVYATWLADLRKRVSAGLEVRSEAIEGAAIVEAVAAKAPARERPGIRAMAARLGGAAGSPAAALETATDPALLEVMNRLQPRTDAARFEPELCIVAEPPLARFGAWYEMFPRSQGTRPGVASTFREAEARLADIRDLGFDVVYLPPIHPIGRTARKGRNNSLVAGPGDPGSPWAIGNEHGGHDAVEPALGTIRDFDHFVEIARRHNLAIALDFALQCSPDHPWVKKHPEWFYRRPDGTIRYAENPPKKYEDIYPLNFDSPDHEALWKEIRRVLEFWIEHGVKIFRVDNPHTKPVEFWRWLIEDIQAAHPEVFFLAEAFTRPPMMSALAKAGFSQSYTYFTWRNTKKELTEYATELSSLPCRDFFRPNFFTSTPDILPEILVTGGRAAFRMRAVLAATLSPTWGIYSGYEICENAAISHHAVPGEYEYADSEKYQIRTRDWNAPGNIRADIARLNAIRRENEALQFISGTVFLESTSDALLAYLRIAPDRRNALVVVVNLDPHEAREGRVAVPPELVGLAPGESWIAHDLLTGARYDWSELNYVRLDPAVQPAHILKVERR